MSFTKTISNIPATALQTIVSCPETVTNVSHSILFVNNSASSAVTFDLLLYSKKANATFTLLKGQLISAASFYIFEKTINLEPGDYVSAVNSSGALVAIVSILQQSQYPVSTPFTVRGTYASATSYSINDIVDYLGATYVATTASINSTPPSSYWQQILSPGAVSPASTTSYGGVKPDNTTITINNAVLHSTAINTATVGTVVNAIANPGAGWIAPSGQILQQAQYPALFAAEGGVVLPAKFSASPASNYNSSQYGSPQSNYQANTPYATKSGFFQIPANASSLTSFSGYSYVTTRVDDNFTWGYYAQQGWGWGGQYANFNTITADLSTWNGAYNYMYDGATSGAVINGAGQFYGQDPIYGRWVLSDSSAISYYVVCTGYLSGAGNPNNSRSINGYNSELIIFNPRTAVANGNGQGQYMASRISNVPPSSSGNEKVSFVVGAQSNMYDVTSVISRSDNGTKYLQMIDNTGSLTQIASVAQISTISGNSYGNNICFMGPWGFFNESDYSDNIRSFMNQYVNNYGTNGQWNNPTPNLKNICNDGTLYYVGLETQSGSYHPILFTNAGTTSATAWAATQLDTSALTNSSIAGVNYIQPPAITEYSLAKSGSTWGLAVQFIQSNSQGNRMPVVLYYTATSRGGPYTYRFGHSDPTQHRVASASTYAQLYASTLWNMFMPLENYSGESGVSSDYYTTSGALLSADSTGFYTIRNRKIYKSTDLITWTILTDLNTVFDQYSVIDMLGLTNTVFCMQTRGQGPSGAAPTYSSVNPAAVVIVVNGTQVVADSYTMPSDPQYGTENLDSIKVYPNWGTANSIFIVWTTYSSGQSVLKYQLYDLDPATQFRAPKITQTLVKGFTPWIKAV